MNIAELKKLMADPSTIWTDDYPVKKIRYRFEPKEDMTAYELAILLKPSMRVIIPANGMTQEELDIVARHLEEI